MAVIVSVLGVLVVGIGVTGVVIPRTVIALVPGRFWFAVGIRLALGVVFLIVAPDCRAPMVVRAVGGVAIAAALGILALGRARLDRFIEWWLGRPLTHVRLWATGAIAFGTLLVYSGP